MIDNDEIFDALAHVERRRLLVELLNEDDQFVSRLSGVSREIADAHEELLRTHLSDPCEIAGVDETLLRTHRVHLPELADDEFVEWDRDALVVTRGPRFDDLRPLLELLDDRRGDRASAEPVVTVRR